MNTSSLQNMKMAARMLCLMVTQTTIKRRTAYCGLRYHLSFSYLQPHLTSIRISYVMFADLNPTKMRISAINLQGRMVVPRMVATSEKNVQLAFLNDEAKQLKSMV